MNETFYKKCNTDLTQRHNNLIKHIIDSFKNSYHIDEKTSKMLRTTDPKTPKILHPTKNP